MKRDCIKRKLSYTIVHVNADGEHAEYIVKGKTTLAKEIKKVLNLFEEVGSVPSIDLEYHHEEDRYITLEDFLENSKLEGEVGNE